MEIFVKIRSVVFLSLLSINVAADEVESQIKMGMEAYKKADYIGALSELKFALAQIQVKVNKQHAKLLPSPLKGWDADEVVNNFTMMEMSGGGSQLFRKYYKGKKLIEISILANSPLLEGILPIISNPMIMSGVAGFTPYKYKRFKGTKEASNGRVEVGLAVSNQVVVQLKGDDVDLSDIENYLDVIDFGEIKKTFLR